jgi:hypothetical protein
LQTLGWRGRRQTAFVVRLYLTVRPSVAALTRGTCSTTHATTGTQRQVEWWRAYCLFVRPHRSLRQHHRTCTPALAAGLTRPRWTVTEVLSSVCARAT